jgi:endonuclease YncB( thermonuclease family)
MLALTFPAPADTNGDGLFDQEGAYEGATVRLKTDRTQDVDDRYGRALAYVNVLSNGQPNRAPGYDVGRDQIRAGWATTYVVRDEFARFNSYTDAETAAEGAAAGVYGACGGDFHAPN